MVEKNGWSKIEIPYEGIKMVRALEFDKKVKRERTMKLIIVSTITVGLVIYTLSNMSIDLSEAQYITMPPYSP